MKKILLVEDDPFLTEIYTTKFQQAGYNIFNAGDGSSAVRVAQEEMPDVVLLDIILPKMSGLEVMKKLKEEEKTKNIIIVILSNLGGEDDVNRAMEAGAAGYIIKSQYTPSEVVARVEEITSK